MNYPNVASAGPLIFIVEDDENLNTLLTLTLNRAGFAVRVFCDSKAVLEAALDQRPAVVLLDDALPSGRETPLLKRFVAKPELKQVRKIMLSTRSTIRERIHALEEGADDYIMTPFAPRELVARVRAMLRSLEPSTTFNRNLQTGPLLADLDAQKVWVDHRLIELTATEFRMLTYLMENAGLPQSRERLLDEIWLSEKNIETQRVVDVYIRRLREKIELDPSDPRRLVTRRGQGYMLMKADADL